MPSSIAASIKNLGQKTKPQIEIKLNEGPRDASHPLVYTSLDKIQGEVSITAQTDMNFDDIYITFEGSTRTYVERIATTSPTNSKTEAYQNFLRLMQPFDPEAFPEPRVLEARRTYRFPFIFVVPDRLLPQSCTHPVDEHFDRNAHLSPPPSFGDALAAGPGGIRPLIDDMAPDMSSICYAIKCRVTCGRGPSGRHLIMAEATKKLRIIPAFEEEPPLDVKGGLEDDYRLRKEKSIRKGIFRQKLGRLSVEATQPKSLRLPGVRSDTSSAPTTMATVNVRFDPLEASTQPPQLNNIVSKLKVATFYATSPMREIPAKSTDFHYSSVRGLFVDTVPLSHRCLANTTWQKHGGSAETLSPERRDSTWSTAATKVPEPSECYNSKFPFYTAHVVVPISLPKGNKAFVPSFHTCLITRVYALDLFLSVNTPNATVTDPTLHLKLPIQISAEGENHGTQALTAQEAEAIHSQEVDEIFQPRNIAPPTPDLTERSNLMGTSRSSPRVTFSNRESIAEEGGEWKPPNSSSQLAGLGIAPRLSGEEVPPSPGPGYSHRPSLEQPRSYSVRMIGTQQRFQSLSFENEEEALAPPPGYSRMSARTTARPPERQSSDARVTSSQSEEGSPSE